MAESVFYCSNCNKYHSTNDKNPFARAIEWEWTDKPIVEKQVGRRTELFRMAIARCTIFGNELGRELRKL